MVGTYHVVSEIPPDSQNDNFWKLDEEMIGRVVCEEVTTSHKSLLEVSQVTNEFVLLREIFTGQEIKKQRRDNDYNTVLLGQPSIGQEHTVWWVDERDNRKWRRSESKGQPSHFYHRAPAVNVARSIEGETRIRSETYYHRLDEFEAWDIRIKDGDPWVIPEALEVNRTLNQIFRQISGDVPDKAHVGTVYTDTDPAEHDRDKDHEIVWFEINYPFRSNTYQTPVEILDRDRYEP